MSVEVLNKWTNSTEYQTWLDMYKGSEGDKSLAITISREDKSFDMNLQVNNNTIRVLDFLVPYYHEIIITRDLIRGIPREDRDSIWPMVWSINKVIKNLSNSAYTYNRSSINPGLISIGTYIKYKDKFYKQIDISQLKYLRKKNL